MTFLFSQEIAFILHLKIYIYHFQMLIIFNMLFQSWETMKTMLIEALVIFI